MRPRGFEGEQKRYLIHAPVVISLLYMKEFKPKFEMPKIVELN